MPQIYKIIKTIVQRGGFFNLEAKKVFSVSLQNQMMNNWLYESTKSEYISFFENLKKCKANNEFYVITYRDLWHGCVIGCVHKVFNNLVDAVKAALEPTTDFRNNSIYLEYGKIIVTGYSGKRVKTVVINQLSKNGVRWFTETDPNSGWSELIERKTAFKNIKLKDLSC